MQRVSGSRILLCHRHNETEIGFDELPECFVITPLNARTDLLFLFRSKLWEFRDFLQIKTQRIRSLNNALVGKRIHNSFRSAFRGFARVTWGGVTLTSACWIF